MNRVEQEVLGEAERKGTGSEKSAKNQCHVAKKPPIPVAAAEKTLCQETRRAALSPPPSWDRATD